MSTSPKVEPQAKAAHALTPLTIDRPYQDWQNERYEVRVSRGPLVIAYVHGNTKKEAEENAELLAAAPETAKQRDELLAVLKAIADEVGAHPGGPRPYSGDSYLPEKFKVLLRAAIAKEEGRT